MQLLIYQLNLFRFRPVVVACLWLERAKLIDDCGNGIFPSWLDYLAALKLVWVDVSYQLTQRLEMVPTRHCLIVFFEEGYRQSLTPEVKREL